MADKDKITYLHEGLFTFKVNVDKDLAKHLMKKKYEKNTVDVEAEVIDTKLKISDVKQIENK